MIYRREFPNTPSKRFRTTILNPFGSSIINKNFYKHHQNNVGRHHGTKVCLRRKKSTYKTKFNLYSGLAKNKYAVIAQLSFARRYKTFVGLLLYSNGSLSASPLFNGAAIGAVIKAVAYTKNPRLYFFKKFGVGDYVPVAYIPIMSCFFNIRASYYSPTWFCKAAGTFCLMIRTNLIRGYCTIKIPSNKYQIVSESSYVMLGRNYNVLPKGIWVGKAGLNIKKGFRPVVRGVAKNPVDHPHGGRTKTNAPERTPWGRVAKFNK